MSDTLLVTGASGQFGQRVLHHLLNSLGVAPGRVVATTRHPATLADWAAKGVTVRAADFDDAASLATAFAGADRLLLISTDALDRPGRRLEQHRSAVQAAAAAGVQHLVYTSMPKPDGSPLLIAPDHAGTEQALAASALPGWTVLRNHWYFENLAMTLPHALATGHWYSAAGDGGLANIARDDLARAAATVLAGTSGGRETFTLSGSRAYATVDIARLVSAALDKPLEVIPVPVDGLIQGMVAAGLPAGLAAVFASFDTNTAAGRVAEVTGDYERITGRQPQSFEDWLQANRSLFAAR